MTNHKLGTETRDTAIGLKQMERRMVFGPMPNCKHIDNWRCCRLPSHQNWFERFFNKRPHCIIDRVDQPRDGKWICPDQVEWPRPKPPTTGSGVSKPMKIR